MIAEEIQRKVLRLWKKKLELPISQRQIATELSLSRATVATIIRRGELLSPSPRRKKTLRPTTQVCIDQQAGICPECERHVVLPCLACLVKRRSQLGPEPEDGEELQLELLPEDELRRLEITARHRPQ